jgi:hypothetical protein
MPLLHETGEPVALHPGLGRWPSIPFARQGAVRTSDDANGLDQFGRINGQQIQSAPARIVAKPPKWDRLRVTGRLEKGLCMSAGRIGNDKRACDQ